MVPQDRSFSQQFFATPVHMARLPTAHVFQPTEQNSACNTAAAIHPSIDAAGAPEYAAAWPTPGAAYHDYEVLNAQTHGQREPAAALVVARGQLAFAACISIATLAAYFCFAAPRRSYYY